MLDTLSDIKGSEYDKYLSFYKEFGKILKEGLHYDFSRKETISDLLLFHSTKTENGEYRTLQDYVNNMKDKHDEIYFISGTSIS